MIIELMKHYSSIFHVQELGVSLMSGATAVKHAAVETDGDLGLVWSALKGNVMDQRHKQRDATKILAQVINCALEGAMICLVLDPLWGSRRLLSWSLQASRSCTTWMFLWNAKARS